MTGEDLQDNKKTFSKEALYEFLVEYSIFSQGIRSIILVIMGIISFILMPLYLLTDTKEQRKARLRGIGLQIIANILPMLLFLGSIAVFIIFSPFKMPSALKPLRVLTKLNPFGDHYPLVAKILIPVVIFLIILPLILAVYRHKVHNSNFCKTNNIMPLRLKDTTAAHTNLDFITTNVGICMRSLDCHTHSNYAQYLKSATYCCDCNHKYFPESHRRDNRAFIKIIKFVVDILLIPFKILQWVLHTIYSLACLAELPVTELVNICGNKKGKYVRKKFDVLVNYHIAPFARIPCSIVFTPVVDILDACQMRTHHKQCNNTGSDCSSQSVSALNH